MHASTWRWTWRGSLGDRLAAVVVLAAALAAAGACRKRAPQAPPPPVDARAATAAPKSELPARGAGMDDPFARLAGDAAKSLNAGYKALRAKKYAEARVAFAAVVAASPDQSTARFQELRAAALGGKTDEVPELWRELLARDFVAYAGRLDKPKELEPLRASPAWARLKEIEAGIRAGYAAGLGDAATAGAFFVARTRPWSAPAPDSAGTVKLATTEEAYHFDLKTGRYRRLSETGGQLYAVHVAPDRKTMALLVTPALARSGPAVDDKTGARTPAGGPVFRDPQVALLSLATLETTGPAPIGPPGTTARAVTMCASAKGETLWQVVDGAGGEAAYVFDSTGTAVVRADGESCTPDLRTEASPTAVRLRRPDVPRVHLSDAHDLLEIEGADKPVRPARPVDPASISWSPGGKRLVYAGVFDPCEARRKPAGAAKAGAKGAAAAGDKNEIYFWDGEKKRAQRIAAAPSHFEAVWLDDDHLLYEAGIDAAARLMVFDAAAGKATALKVRAGGGLYGYPRAACEEEVDEGAAEDHEGIVPEDFEDPEGE